MPGAGRVAEASTTSGRRWLFACLVCLFAHATSAWAEPAVRQVMIETRIVEVNIDSLEELGIDHRMDPDSGSWGFDPSTPGTPVSTSLLLDALAGDGDFNVLSAPRLTTSAGEPATIKVGGETQVPQPGDAGAFRSEDFSLELTVTPTITPDDEIRMTLVTKVSGLDTSSERVQVTERFVQTDVMLKDGQTTVVGGLFQQDARSFDQQAPFLGDVPVLGRLFRSRSFQDGKSELMVFVTPTLLGEDGEAPSSSGYVPPPKPRSNISVAGGYFHQDLPSGNGGLGVTGVGNDEKPFLSLPDVIGTGVAGTQLTIPIPVFEELDTNFLLDGWYAGGSRKFSDEVEARQGVSNGITYWQESQQGFTGFQQPDSKLEGSGKLEVDAFQFNAGVQLNLTSVFDPMIDRVCGSEAQQYHDGAVWSARPSFIFEATAGFGYLRQESTSTTQVLFNSPSFSQYDVYTRNEIDLTEWNTEATFGLLYSQPVPAIRGLTLVTGADFGLGWRTSNGDGEQHNQCDVRFAIDPNTNQCQPSVQDFRISEDIERSGFDWSLGATARLDYRPIMFSDRLKLSFGYGFDYVGVSRFRTPTNLQEDGSPRIQKTQQPQHRLEFGVQYSF